ncbi:MAG: SCO family protein [Flavobacteriales bacterium]|nr:SCO family protein [Flavobacteriales bacterium]MDW8431961.1 SCO family protein [Flavobacteriales bacterium]
MLFLKKGRKIFLGASLVLLTWSCRERTSGKFEISTVSQKIAPVLGKAPEFFCLTNQDSQQICREDVAGKIWVADFFFTTCPTICPRMSDQMARLRDSFLHENRLVLLSHSIDPEHDKPFVLKAYAQRLGGTGGGRWHLLTGPRDTIFELAQQYSIAVSEEASAPGGFIHSGAFVLVDTQGRIRGFYDGTRAEETDRLMDHIRTLLDEKTTQ